MIADREDRIRALEGALEGLLIIIADGCSEACCRPSRIKEAAAKAKTVLEDRIDDP